MHVKTYNQKKAYKQPTPLSPPVTFSSDIRPISVVSAPPSVLNNGRKKLVLGILGIHVKTYS